MTWHFAEFDADTAAVGGKITFTHPTMTDTPTGCVIYMNRSGTSNTAVDAYWSMGVCDGTNEWCDAGAIDHNTTGNTYARYTRDSCVLRISETSGAVQDELSFDSFSAGAVVLNEDNAFGTGYKLLICYWTGANFACNVQDMANYPETITTGFQPDGVGFSGAVGNVWDDTAQANAFVYTGIGFAGWDSSGTLTQASANWSYGYDSGSSFCDAQMYVSSSEVMVFLGNGSTDDTFDVTGRSSTGFTYDINTTVSGGLYDFGWFAFGDDPTPKSVVVQTHRFTSGTGEIDWTGSDGAVEAILVANTSAATAGTDTLVQTLGAESTGWGGGRSDSEEFCQYISGDDQSGATSLASGHDTRLVSVERLSGFGDKTQKGSLVDVTEYTHDQWTLDKEVSKQAWFIAMTVCTWPTAVTWVKGNTEIQGNTKINP